MKKQCIFKGIVGQCVTLHACAIEYIIICPYFQIFLLKLALVYTYLNFGSNDLWVKKEYDRNSIENYWLSFLIFIAYVSGSLNEEIDIILR